MVPAGYGAVTVVTGTQASTPRPPRIRAGDRPGTTAPFCPPGTRARLGRPPTPSKEARVGLGTPAISPPDQEEGSPIAAPVAIATPVSARGRRVATPPG